MKRQDIHPGVSSLSSKNEGTRSFSSHLHALILTDRSYMVVDHTRPRPGRRFDHGTANNRILYLSKGGGGKGEALSSRALQKKFGRTRTGKRIPNADCYSQTR